MKKPWFVALGVWALLAVFYLAQGELVRVHFPLDDAWIHQVYARSFSSGDWFAFNPGQQETGATSPLWAIVTAPTHWFEGAGIDVVVVAIKLLGLAFVAIALVQLQRALSTITTAGVAGAAVALIALEPRMMFSALSGMETTLLLALVAGSLAAYLHGRLKLSGFLIALAPTCRPEAALLLLAWGIGVLVLPKEQRLRGRQLLWLPLTGVPLFAWGLYCQAVTGHWLPNTFYAKAKSPPLGEALGHLVEILVQRGIAATIAFWVGLVAFIAVCILKRSRAHVVLVLALVGLPALYGLGVVLSRPVDPTGYYWTRWLDPAVLLLTCASCAGLAIALAEAIQRVREKRWTERGWLAAGGAAALGCALGLPVLARDTIDLRLKLATDAYVIETNNESVGRWIADNTPPNAVIGLQDAGAIHYFGNRVSIDILGLNSHAMLFRQIKLADFTRQIDWFVGYPDLVRKAKLPLEPVVSFSVPYELYTICPCPTQVEMVIYEKTR